MKTLLVIIFFGINQIFSINGSVRSTAKLNGKIANRAGNLLPISLMQSQSTYSAKEFLSFCKQFRVKKSKYKTLIAIQDNFKPFGYMFKMVFFFRGDNEAFIWLSDKSIADPTARNYEFVLGGWNTTYPTVRYRTSLAHEVRTFHLSAGVFKGHVANPRKFLVEIMENGNIQIFIVENGYYISLVSAYDPIPLNVRYFAFGSYGDKNLEFYYNCPGDGCTQYFTNQYLYQHFFKIDDMQNMRPAGITVRFIFYVKGPAEAHILLVKDRDAKEGYEIVIDGYNGAKTSIISRNKVELGSVNIGSLLSTDRVMRFLIEISTQGDIFLAAEQDMELKKVILVKDTSPVYVNYISFASYANLRVEYYFGCIYME